MSDDLSAALEPIRERSEAATRMMVSWKAQIQRARASADDVPLLLGAVRAVLEPHQPGPFVILGAPCRHHRNHRNFSITVREAADVEACASCGATVYRSCAGCGTATPLDSCPVRTVIARELTRKEAGNG